MNPRGFTLIEMMMTIAIAAILVSLAVPSFQNLIVNNRLTTQANELVADLNVARSEAIKRGQRVSICPSNNATSCTATPWTDGRLIFVDGSTAGTVDGTDQILRSQPALTGNLSLASAGFGGAAYIQYVSSGTTGSAGTFTLCRSGFVGRVISVSATGRPSTQATGGLCP